MADTHLVVGSLEVLGDMSGNGIKTIQQKITAIEQKQAFTPDPVDYWSELISDGVITPIEKKTIKQQFEEINSIHSQLEQQAALQDKSSEEVWINYNDTFYALQNYLYTTLKLFDDMTVSSPVADRDLFNEYFSTYYSNQSAAQILLTQGEPGRVRNLTNLNEYGTDGEVAVYRNWFYIYNAKTAKWNAVPNTEFLGALNVEPINCNRNQYFLASESFKASKSVIGINRKAIAILNKIFKASFYFKKGSIYVWKGNTWKEDSDRNSYRYLVATNDIITQGGEISPNLQEAITSVSGTTGYLGMFVSDPENVPFNSYYVYIGENTDTRENGTIYIYKHDGWKALDPNNPDTYSYYMKVLKDCLGSTDVQTGAFSSLFANTLASNTAFITALFTEQLTLLQNGFIQSQGYKPGTGFKIQANGHAEFNDITLGTSVKAPLAGTATNVSGGSIADMTTGGSEDTSIALHSGNWRDPNSANGFGILKNGDAYFNNGKFRGDLVAKSLAVENEITVGENFRLNENGILNVTEVVANNGYFNGTIESGPLILKAEAPSGKVDTYAAGTRFKTTSFYGLGTYGPYKFDTLTQIITEIKVSIFGDYAYNCRLTLTFNGNTVFNNTQLRNPDPGYILDYTLTLTKPIPSDAKTFKLLNLPTTMPEELGTVWNDHGTLKIVN